ncbi:MAG TPA: protease inhibitor I42 family protein [Pirellulales bacterium]|nr:protease inhibitor I42 family protein [Pirellulales bacterium]
MLTVGHAADGTEITAPLEQEFEIQLPENPTTGYRWHLADGSSETLQVVDEHFDTATAAVGAAGQRRWTVRATAPGSHPFRLEERRSWEQKPIRTFSLTVKVASPP